MKAIFISILMISSLNAFSALTKSFDSENNCTLFRSTSENSPATQEETIVLNKELYGLSFLNMEIDFSNRVVLVDATANVVLGLNRSLTTQKAIISPKNKDFNFLINQLNRKVMLFEKVCINSNNEIVYAKMFETQQTK